ncbi:MAG: acetyltransferase [Chloroflexi bacterium]|nr:acetyltransferase [Chloroflexota bacterium]|tara:strand:+ start:11648 stop:12217 length:570 start_codon:yes stop_codon:yes gene_type:complete
MNFLKRIFRKLFPKRPYILGKNSVIYPCVDMSNVNGRKEDLVIGDNTHVRAELFMILGHGGKIIIGDYCFVGRNTHIWSGKSIKIGNRVLISHNCNIFDNDTHPKDPIDRHLQYKEIITKGQPKEIDLKEEEVVIEDDVWIGANVTIMKGVKIGERSIIGANSLVLDNVPEDCFFAGNPAKLIKKLDNP